MGFGVWGLGSGFGDLGLGFILTPKLPTELEKKAEPNEEMQAAMLAVNKEGLMIKVRG